MGIGIVPILMANLANSVAKMPLKLGGLKSVDPMPNNYGERFREQIIRKAIKRCRPLPFIPFKFLDICPVNAAAQVLNVKYGWNDAYRILVSYHCSSYFDIPKEIRRIIPQLVREALTPGEV